MTVPGLQQFGESAKSLSRNPLGIIALFIVLVYGIAALLTWKTSEETGSRVIMTWFVVAFPVLVLAAFVYLVGWHHPKLYAPSDYRNDDAFMRMSQTETMLLAEVKADEAHRPPQGRRLTDLEYKILNTLWTKTVNRFPDYSGVWTFRIHGNVPLFPAYHEAASSLIKAGLVNETNSGQLYLTHEGFQYCKHHHHEFPPDQWWPEEQVNSEKLARAVAFPDP